MKRVYIAGIGAIALIATLPFATQIPGVASLWNSGAIAQNTKVQSQIQLRLEAEKKIVTKNEQGKPQITWQSLTDKALVQPGDIIRYTLHSENKSDRKLKNLIVNQPIPKEMVYVLKSVNPPSKDAKITYSIDGGKTFVENPTVKVQQPNGTVVEQPAPATAYTSLRLQVPLIDSKATLKASYETQVR